MNGKEEEKEGAACMAGKPILPVMHNMENKIKLCRRTSVNISVKQNKICRYRHSRYSRDDELVSVPEYISTTYHTTIHCLHQCSKSGFKVSKMFQKKVPYFIKFNY
jgi:hypothetical protein